MLQRHCFQFLFSAVPNRFKYVRMYAKETLMFPIFSLQFQIIANTVKMHDLDTSFLLFFLCSSKQCQNACIRNILFNVFSAVPNRFKYVRMYALKTSFSKKCLQFQVVSNTGMHNVCFRDIVFIFSLQFQIIANTVNMHDLETSFSFSLCSCKSFQILSSNEYTFSLHTLRTSLFKHFFFLNVLFQNQ